MNYKNDLTSSLNHPLQKKKVI